MSKPKLLIIDLHPYGSLTDSYKWCEYLRSDYNITLLTLRTNSSLKAQKGIRHISVKYGDGILNKLKARILFVLFAFFNAMFFTGKIFVVYYKSCVLLKQLLPWKKMHLDIRTLSVAKDTLIRAKEDNAIAKGCRIFDTVSIISKGLLPKLNLANASILPLGSDIISSKPKNFSDSINLLYVGTLRGREIDKTINGLAIFLKTNPSIDIHYDIIGTGNNSENEAIMNAIQSNHLDKIVTYHGFVNHNNLAPFFDKANVGIAYVPITDYYKHQPPTKVYEYALSGLFTIATDTAANHDLITHDNGLLIDDTAESFAEGLRKYELVRSKINESLIRNSLISNTWKNIVKTYLKPILEA